MCSTCGNKHLETTCVKSRTDISQRHIKGAAGKRLAKYQREFGHFVIQQFYSEPSLLNLVINQIKEFLTFDIFLF